MDWALEYYTRQSETFGRAVVTEHNHATADRLHRWCTERRLGPAILELGSGAGGVASAMAGLGYEVTGVEFNPSDAALARTLAAETPPGSFTPVEADFYEVELGRRFGFLYYWDGFGIGSDHDQRRLLRRIAHEWLEPGGVAALDVFSPWNWMKRAGDTSTYTARDGTSWQRTTDFDIVGCRMVDSWHPQDDPATRRSQSIRCYTIPEMHVLAAGTGLEIEAIYTMSGEPVDVTSSEATEELRHTNGYFALLRTDTKQP